MKGWSPFDRLHRVPNKNCPGDLSDYYWNHVTKEWVYVNDDDDMRWWFDGLFGYDTGPSEEPKGWMWPNESYTGKQWKEERKSNNNKTSVTL